jgi:hypothetical protein
MAMPPCMVNHVVIHVTYYPPLAHIIILHYWGLCTESFLGSFSSKIVVFEPFSGSKIF